MKNFYIISGSSGSGKTTLLELLSRDLSIEISVSYTTRKKRKYEIDGVHYNFISEEKFKEYEERKSYLSMQKEDLVSALNSLEDAIKRIDKDTKERFKDTFEKVDKKLQDIFPKLFNGGKAYLKMTENDLLKTGVAVCASPPGKKLQNLTLLSGGEQALTALSLLFAVFLSNPAPICVLDEVDSPLDDTNVDRFCSLVEEIAKTSSTKFLVITHHRMTMARVNRLFGVTMPEQGVSQLVSVDLEKAIEIREQDSE